MYMFNTKYYKYGVQSMWAYTFFVSSTILKGKIYYFFLQIL